MAWLGFTAAGAASSETEGAAHPSPVAAPALVRLLDEGGACAWWRGSVEDRGERLFEVPGRCADVVVSASPAGDEALVAVAGGPRIWRLDLASARLSPLPVMRMARVVVVGYERVTPHALIEGLVGPAEADHLGLRPHQLAVNPSPWRADGSFESSTRFYVDLQLFGGQWREQEQLTGSTETAEGPDLRNLSVYPRLTRPLEAQQGCPPLLGRAAHGPTARRLAAACRPDVVCPEGVRSRGLEGPLRGAGGRTLGVCRCLAETIDESVAVDVGGIVAAGPRAVDAVRTLAEPRREVFAPPVSLTYRGDAVLIVPRPMPQGASQEPGPFVYQAWRGGPDGWRQSAGEAPERAFFWPRRGT